MPIRCAGHLVKALLPARRSLSITPDMQLSSLRARQASMIASASGEGMYSIRLCLARHRLTRARLPVVASEVGSVVAVIVVAFSKSQQNEQ